MPYLIKRYANRKLYDTRTRRYVTLDEVAEIVRSGEEVRVDDAETGVEITAQVLARVIAEGHRRGGAPLLSPKTLVELIQHPADTVAGAVRTSVSAGQRGVDQVTGEMGRLFESVASRVDGPARQVGAAASEVVRAIDDRLRAAVAALGLPTQGEFERLAARVDALEARKTTRTPSKKRPATKASKTRRS